MVVAETAGAAAVLMGEEPPLSPAINDLAFIRDLERLKELRSFLIQEAVYVDATESKALSFGRLNLLHYSEKGRSPTEREWTAVEQTTQALFALLTDPLRKKFVLGAIPSWVSLLPIALAGVALGSLVLAIFIVARASSGEFSMQNVIRVNAYTLPLYLVWLMSLGAIGAVAFVGMNALAVQQDATFDLGNRRLMILRIVLGALFGLVLTLPFGFRGFMDFVGSLAGVTPDKTPAGGTPVAAATSAVTTQAMLLLLPFVLGFSTSLVIMILNRLIDSVQAFFGRPQDSERGAKAPTASRPA